MRISDWSSDVCSSDLSRNACRSWLPLAERCRRGRRRAWPRGDFRWSSDRCRRVRRRLHCRCFLSSSLGNALIGPKEDVRAISRRASWRKSDLVEQIVGPRHIETTLRPDILVREYAALNEHGAADRKHGG